MEEEVTIEKDEANEIETEALKLSDDKKMKTLLKTYQKALLLVSNDANPNFKEKTVTAVHFQQVRKVLVLIKAINIRIQRLERKETETLGSKGNYHSATKTTVTSTIDKNPGVINGK